MNAKGRRLTGLSNEADTESVAAVDAVFGPAFQSLLAEVEREQERRFRDEANRGWRAMMLAKDLETCRALLRGESVPLERLDPKWVRRFGIERRTAA